MRKRLSVTLEAEDEEAVARFARDGAPERKALTEWAASHGIEMSDSTSEAALLRLLLRVGVDALQRATLDVSYAQLAASIELDDGAHDSRAARDRYVARSEAKRSR